MATTVTASSTTLTVDPSQLSVAVAFDGTQTTQVSLDPVSERNDKASTIIAASTVIGFLFLGVTGVLLFLKITRYLRVRRDNKRFREWNSLENTKAHPRNRHFVGRRSMKNAFDIVEDDEGIPA